MGIWNWNCSLPKETVVLYVSITCATSSTTTKKLSWTAANWPLLFSPLVMWVMSNTSSGSSTLRKAFNSTSWLGSMGNLTLLHHWIWKCRRCVQRDTWFRICERNKKASWDEHCWSGSYQNSSATFNHNSWTCQSFRTEISTWILRPLLSRLLVNMGWPFGEDGTLLCSPEEFDYSNCRWSNYHSTWSLPFCHSMLSTTLKHGIWWHRKNFGWVGQFGCSISRLCQHLCSFSKHLLSHHLSSAPFNSRSGPYHYGAWWTSLCHHHPPAIG